jgi:hypothetical protein
MFEADCPACGDKFIERIYDFGLVPPVNTFPAHGEDCLSSMVPLVLNVCTSCWLLHLSKPPKLELMFENYHYRSGSIEGNVQHLCSVSEFLGSRFDGSKKILEVGCNDGTLLKFLNKKFNKCVGIDPAKNLDPQPQCDVFTGFFDMESAKVLSDMHGLFDVVVGLNVFAHNIDCVGMMHASESILQKEGVLVIEVAYAPKTILKGNYDTIYHEHVYSFSLTSLQKTMQISGLRVIDIEMLETQGGSVRVLACKADADFPINERVGQVLAEEKKMGINNIELYRSLSSTIEQKITAISAFIDRMNQAKKRVLLAGAPARGVVLLNTARSRFEPGVVAADDTPEKQGRLMPGLNIPVLAWPEITADDFDVAFVLSWNYEKKMIRDLRDIGFVGSVYVPFPSLKNLYQL